MSESGDSFEKVEINDQQLVDLTTNDQKSSDLTSNDQHSNSESSVTTMSGSADQAKTEQSIKSVQHWKARNEFLCNLAQHMKQTTDLANELQKLKIGMIASSNKANERKYDEPNNAKSSPTVEEVAILKEELEQLKASVIDNKGIVRSLNEELAASKGELTALKGELTALKGELATSKEELEKFKLSKGEADVYGEEEIFTFELKDVEALLTGRRKVIETEVFFYEGIPWLVKACVEVKEGVDYVGVYLYHKSIIYWSVVATFEIRLLCSDPLGNSTFVVSRDLEFKNPDKFKAWGYSKFISVDKLRSGSFIQNDTVKIQVQISTKSFKIAN